MGVPSSDSNKSEECRDDFFLYWEKLIYDLWEQFRDSVPDTNADDLVDDICRTWSLKKWETNQQQIVTREYKFFLKISYQKGTKLEQPIKQFFRNDDIFTTNLPSIESLIDIFNHLPQKPNSFAKKFDSFLYKKVSIQDPIIRQELTELFEHHVETALLLLYGIRARKKD